jgi:haloalkane dehalogenase
METIEILDSTIAYVDVGEGAPIVLLHGNPMSSYLWRNVIPAIGSPGRCLAPDLIGTGASGKPDIDYRIADHVRYLEAWIDALMLDDILFVGHDWGGVLALDWAARHVGRTRGVAFLETIVRPLAWDEFPPSGQQLFRGFRTEGVGEQMVLEQNVLIEKALPMSVRRTLSEAEMDAYRMPFPTPESRRPLLRFPREIPIDGEPADVVERVAAYGRWMADTPEVPKLLLAFEGAPWSDDALIGWCEEHVAGLEVTHCGPALHHAPEDQPEAIGAAVAAWADRHGLRTEPWVAAASQEVG